MRESKLEKIVVYPWEIEIFLMPTSKKDTPLNTAANKNIIE